MESFEQANVRHMMQLTNFIELETSSSPLIPMTRARSARYIQEVMILNF